VLSKWQAMLLGLSFLCTLTFLLAFQGLMGFLTAPVLAIDLAFFMVGASVWVLLLLFVRERQ